MGSGQFRKRMLLSREFDLGKVVRGLVPPEYPGRLVPLFAEGVDSLQLRCDLRMRASDRWMAIIHAKSRTSRISPVIYVCD